MQFSFSDFDAYHEAALLWGLDFVQLDRGRLTANLSMVASNNILISHTKLNRTFQQQGLAPDIGRTFGLYADVASEVRWLNQYFGEDTLAVFPADRTFEAASAPDFSVYAVTVSDEALELVAKTYDLQESLRKLPPLGGVLQCRAADIAFLRRWIGGVLYRARTTFEISRAEELDTAHLILKALSQRVSGQRLPSWRSRDRAYADGVAYILANLGKQLTIPDICTAVGASERTLRYTFEERLGVSPSAYVKAARLDRAHAALLQADGEQDRVYDIAADLGFRHMSQFATDYRRKYGEKPSETLMR